MRLVMILLLWGLMLPSALGASLPEVIDRVRPSIVGVGTAYPPRQPNRKGDAVSYRGTGFVVGNGLHTFRGVQREPERYPQLTGTLDEYDAILLSKHRVANLGKLFPYLPAELNEVLLRFSCGASHFYEDLESQLDDLRAVFGE